ncbi:TraK family protein [Pseudomonas sp. 1P02AnB]|uniref:TraK family protein n=2 Tax=Pseudomonas TaxID=286 RepID=UPI0039AFDEDA
MMRNDSLKSIKRRAGRAEFLSVREELETKILHGYTLKMIYTEYIDRFSFGYIQFTRYVSRYCNKSRSFILTSAHWIQK